MTILIIGGNGFIGSHITQTLLDDGKKVRVLGRNVTNEQCATFLGKSPENCVFFKGDFRKREDMLKALDGVDIVIHAASTTVPSTSMEDPRRDIEDNLIGMLVVMEAMREKGVKKLIFISSGGTVYGLPESDLIPETHPRFGISPYGITKAAIENFIKFNNHVYGLNYQILRVSNPYGPRMPLSGSQGFIGVVFGKIIKKEKIAIFGNGKVVRDYVFVSDVAELVKIAVETNINGIFNVGSGDGYNLLDIVEEIENTTNSKLEIEFNEARKFDVPKVVLDCSAAQKQFGWKAKTSLAQGLKITWDYLINQEPNK